MRRNQKLSRYLLVAVFSMASFTAICQGWIARHNLTAAQYQSEFTAQGKLGYYPKMVSGYSMNNQPHYSALWTKPANMPASEFKHGLTAAQYQAAVDDFGKKGYVLTYVQGFSVNNTAYFNGIWQKLSNAPAYIARHNLDKDAYQKIYTDFKDYRPKVISAYTINGKEYFAGIWEKAPNTAWVARHGLTPQQYQDEFTKWVGQGYKLTSIAGYTSGGKELYAGVWQKVGGPAWYARHAIPGAFYQSVFDNFYYQGYMPNLITTYNVNNEVKFAGVWDAGGISSANMQKLDDAINDYMKKNNVPGLSVAFVKGDRLVFSKGYGFAVKETGEPAGPNHRYRIASVSKPITALGIMKLAEQGKLSLGDKVFGSGGILSSFTVPNTNSKVNAITVSHLLHHTSGFQNVKGDPAFMKYDLTIPQMIQWELDNEINANGAGVSYMYANFNFILLARIIEVKTGKTYEQFVRDNILQPSGVTQMVIGANDLSAKKANEVQYYGSSAGSNPYQLHLDRMAGNGGWIASAPDLARVLVRVNGTSAKPDILQKKWVDSLRIMTVASTPNNYGNGYVVIGGGKGHNGAMSGTNAFMHDDGNGGGYSVVLNTRAEQDTFAWGLDAILMGFLNSITWPAFDLF